MENKRNQFSLRSVETCVVTLKKTIELNDTKNEAFRSQERGIFCSAPVLLDFFAIQGTCKASKEEWVLVSNGPVQALRTLRVPRAVPTGSRPQGSGGAAVSTQARRVFLTGRERASTTSTCNPPDDVCWRRATPWRLVLRRGPSALRLLRSMRQLASGSGSGTP